MAGKGAQHASNVLNELENANRPLSAYDLLDRLRPTGIAAPLTIYRALDRLMEAGQAHRIESLNAFVACRVHRDGSHDHIHPVLGPAGSGPSKAGKGKGGRAVQGPKASDHHEGDVVFALCDECGAVEEFAERGLTSSIENRLASSGFAMRSSTIEIHGLCRRCQ